MEISSEYSTTTIKQAPIYMYILLTLLTKYAQLIITTDEYSGIYIYLYRYFNIMMSFSSEIFFQVPGYEIMYHGF